MTPKFNNFSLQNSLSKSAGTHNSEIYDHEPNTPLSTSTTVPKNSALSTLPTDPYITSTISKQNKYTTECPRFHQERKKSRICASCACSAGLKKIIPDLQDPFEVFVHTLHYPLEAFEQHLWAQLCFHM
ncbi:hypothetical protein O181_062640 [Austropuccinia psidii MF-1]|uniref:Uncharacterized protein n=1 Tax=Austropuccinia psidii MF-1 TaxID=1389203 RepID=A0A9Q3I1I3_9BASI|nr:hypothetical protein [Austropuccinia psidii MF-1]